MSMRFDIALALKRGPALDSLRNHPVLKDASETHEHEEGILFVFDDVKWSKFDQEVDDLYTKLEDYESDHFLVAASHDYPMSSEEYDSGDWEENPFELYREVRASLSYNKD